MVDCAFAVRAWRSVLDLATAYFMKKKMMKKVFYHEVA
jgi:hypothetical protein